MERKGTLTVVVRNELYLKEISDVSDGPFDSFGADDIAGKMFTGKNSLACGVVAMETLLDWATMGNINVDNAFKFS